MRESHLQFVHHHCRGGGLRALAAQQQKSNLSLEPVDKVIDGIDSESDPVQAAKESQAAKIAKMMKQKQRASGHGQSPD